MPQATVNGLTIEYETFGPADGEPLLLIMGLGAQMTRWPEGLIGKLTDAGLRVIRFDNRDVGLSSKLDAAGVPNLGEVFGALQAGTKPNVPYTLDDMAADAVGLLDALAIERAHIVGASLGGMVAQLVAADYPERTLSLSSIMSNTGHRDVPRATPEATAVLNERGPDPREDFQGYLAHAYKGALTVGSPAYPPTEAEIHARSRADFERCYYPAGFARQYAAAASSPERRPKLANVTAPTVVIHGVDDPLIPVEGGRDTAEHVRGAELVEIPGMGHDMPAALHGAISAAILKAVERSRAPEALAD